MRVMLKVNLPVERANQMVKEGRLSSTIKSILDELKPESAYFTTDKGMRTGYLFFDISRSSEIPKVAEPWFLAFDAGLEIVPVMAPEDLEAAGPYFEPAVKKYG